MKKYTYNDWWKGIICPADDNAPEGLIKWKDIVATDIIKIKEKQKEIFDSEAEKLFIDLKKIFIDRKNKSKEPYFLIENTLNEIKEILFGKVPKVDMIVTDYLELRIPQTEYKTLRNYIKNIYENGMSINYNLIFSPNHALKQLNDPLFDGEGLYRFYKWLDKLSKETDEFSINDGNPFPEIFRDNDSYKLYSELKEKLIKNNSLITCHSFIYHTLKYNNHLKDIRQKAYIDFLIENEGVTILANRIMSRRTDYLKVLLKKHFPHLNQY